MNNERQPATTVGRELHDVLVIIQDLGGRKLTVTEMIDTVRALRGGGRGDTLYAAPPAARDADEPAE